MSHTFFQSEAFVDATERSRDEPNAEMKRVILADLLSRLRDAGLLADGLTLDDAKIDEIRSTLEGSRLMGITEFGRAVHAEMAAITDAARRGISVAGAKLLCTTFPCHNCAKHIVAAGIREVIYIEPYPKSQVAWLFSDCIALDQKPGPTQVRFFPFVAFAPTRFVDFFQMRNRVDDQKHILSWDSMKRTARPRVSGIPSAYLQEELTAIEDLKKKMAEKRLIFPERYGRMSKGEELQKAMDEASRRYQQIPEWLKRQSSRNTSASVERTVRPASGPISKKR